MEPHITPEPNEAERKAILAALATEEAEKTATSEWAEALMPPREETEYEP